MCVKTNLLLLLLFLSFFRIIFFWNPSLRPVDDDIEFLIQVVEIFSIIHLNINYIFAMKKSKCYLVNKSGEFFTISEVGR